MIANIQIVIAGAAAGSLIGLLASGLMIQYRSSGVLNFGHGAVAALSAYIYVHLAGAWGWPPAAAAVFGILAGGIVTSIFQALVIRPLHGASVLAKTVASLGLMLSIGAIIVLTFGHDIQPTKPLFRSSRLTIPFGGSVLSIGTDRLVLVVASVGICTLLWALFRFSAFGRATRAVADNRRAAELMGYSSLRMEWLNWTLGGLMAGLAGVLISTISPPNVSSYTAALLGALSVALLAKFRSFGVLLAAGIGLGAVQALLQRYGGDLQSLTGLTGWSDMVPLAIILIAVLTSGSTIASKGLVKEQPLPEAPVVQRLGLAVAICFVAGAVWIALVPATWVDPTTGTLIRFISALSLVVLTGYAGQISLGQMTIAGIGAFAAAKTAATFGLPFPLPVFMGGLLALCVAAVFGAPALRTRGLNLAVVTLGLATVVEVAFFANRDLGVSVVRVFGTTGGVS